jgi:hypothetical protein
MSQDDIEAFITARFERMVEHLDRMLLLRHISQEDYTKALAELAEWAERKRAVAKRVS